MNTVSLYNLLLNDRLSNMVNVVVNVLGDSFSQINNGAFLGSVRFSIVMLSS